MTLNQLLHTSLYLTHRVHHHFFIPSALTKSFMRFDFLKQYQGHPANNEYLWIDQLCLDQTNTSERNHRVKLMSRTYRCCLQVVVWLDRSSRENAYRYKASTVGIPQSPGQLLKNIHFTRL